MSFHDLEQALAVNGSVTLTQPRLRMILMLPLAAAFTGAGILMVMNEVWFGWVAIGFFGILGIPAILWQIAHPRTTVVTAQGIAIHKNPPVPWTQTDGVEQFGASSNRLIVIMLTPEFHDHMRSQKSPAQRALQSANNVSVGAPSVALPSPLPFKADLVQAWLETVRWRAIMGTDAH